MIKKNTIIIILLLSSVMFFCACANGEASYDNRKGIIDNRTPDEDSEQSVVLEDSTQQQQENTEQIEEVEPTQQNEVGKIQQEQSDAKYIFLIIGDGMGQTHLKLGDMFLKLVYGDMNENGAWNDFDMKTDVIGGVESSRGGTMLSTGEEIPSGGISHEDGEDFTTIVDLAKQNGLATGVISNASFVDATPASFLSHADYRSKSQKLAKSVYDSNADIIIGGGIEYTYPNDGINKYIIDAAGEKIMLPMKNYNLVEMLKDNGYETYVGQDANVEVKKGNTYEKAFFSFTKSDLMFNFLRKTERQRDSQKDIPELDELTALTIRSLEQDEDGFFLMVEESANDDASHLMAASYIAAEMGMMDKTLDVVMDFYNKHPQNTTIVLVADHECGNLKFDEDKYREFTNIEKGIPWEKSAQEINDFLRSEIGHEIDINILNTTKEYIDSDFYGRDFENRMLASGAVINRICREYGIEIRSDVHSYQNVPLYVKGQYADEFKDASIISDVPKILCDVWDLEGDLGKNGD